MQDRPQPDRAPLVPAVLLNSVVAYFNPRQVIVFGSVARGDAGPHSDIDLLVIVDDDTPAEKVTLKAGTSPGNRITHRLMSFRSGKRPFDRTRGSLEHCREQQSWMASWCMTDPDHMAR